MVRQPATHCLLVVVTFPLLAPVLAAEGLSQQSLYVDSTAVIARDLRAAQGPRHIVFCVDVSGSMTGLIAGMPGESRQRAAAAACTQLLAEIVREGDFVSVINFAQEPQTIVNLMAADAIKPDGITSGSFAPSVIADLRE